MKKKNCYLIAEIGVNHNNSISVAKKLILSAKNCGADAVKFQTFNAERLANINTPKAKYQKRSGPKNETHFQMLKKLELNEKNHLKLKEYCEKIKIDFISTPYDLQSLKFLIKLGLKVIKISSADLIDHQMHNYLAKNKIKVIISTGMSEIKEIDETIKIYKKYKSNKFSLLHCVSNYPCSDLSLNLKNIITLRKRYNCEVGFSDHSIGEVASIISIGYGAKIIEKHFTLNKNMDGPDHLASSAPKEFGSLVKLIRRAEMMKGSYDRKIQKEEIDMRKISRKSLIYLNNFKSGHTIKSHNITSTRPANGLGGNKLNSILNRKLIRNVKKQNLVSLKDFKKK